MICFPLCIFLLAWVHVTSQRLDNVEAAEKAIRSTAKSIKSIEDYINIKNSSTISTVDEIRCELRKVGGSIEIQLSAMESRLNTKMLEQKTVLVSLETKVTAVLTAVNKIEAAVNKIETLIAPMVVTYHWLASVPIILSYVAGTLRIIPNTIQFLRHFFGSYSK
jgi:SMC interacting uncharacterized protein involved in chromosome segregation